LKHCLITAPLFGLFGRPCRFGTPCGGPEGLPTVVGRKAEDEGAVAQTAPREAGDVQAVSLIRVAIPSESGTGGIFAKFEVHLTAETSTVPASFLW